MSSTKGLCPVCGESIGVRKDGLIRSHGYLKQQSDIFPCAGTNQEPRISTDGAFSALCLATACTKPTAAIVWAQDEWLSLCKKDAIKSLKAI